MASDVDDVCQLLEWDSSFWGLPIARLWTDTLSEERLRQVDAWCAECRVGCLYFLARSDDAETSAVAETGGFRFVDVRLTLSQQPGHFAAASGDRESHCAIRPARPADVSILRGIASEVHHDTRFYFDRSFPRRGADLLYSTWIQRSCCEGYADAVLVAEVADQPAGYITCHLDAGRRIGSIGLLGVGSQARGRGAGQALVRAAQDWLTRQHVEEINVVTQGRNTGAQRLYQHHGFRTKQVQLWYHKWYSAS